MVESWLVLEKDPNTNKIVFNGKFDSYAEAKNMYEQLKNLNEESVVSIEKVSKTFLVEG